MPSDDYYESAAHGRRPTSDFEWYAVDREGQIAFLTSAGFGAVPMLVFRDKSMYFRVDSFFRSLTGVGTCYTRKALTTGLRGRKPRTTDCTAMTGTQTLASTWR